MQNAAPPAKPLFITDAARSLYFNAYDAVLKKYGIAANDHWVETHLGKAHVIETGNPAGKPLVLLHAAGCSAAEWYANFEALGRDYHLYAVDTPGDAGKSELRKLPLNIGDYILMLRQILDAFRLEKPALLGHSIGGFFAAGFAIAHPERVEKLILLSPVATHVPIRWYLRLMLKFTGRPGTGPHAVKTLKMQAFKGFEPEPLFADLMEHVRNYCTVEMLFPYVYSDEDLFKIEMPTYLIVGTGEPLCNYERSVKLARQKIPHIQITVLENTGHTPNMERPEETNRLLLEILKR
ncbi:MAG: alpha/beta hydrolase [Saprospiraceae bacterium]|nr:alpha/beta hydrolase [Saprospiraceae bacterium]